MSAPVEYIVFFEKWANEGLFNILYLQWTGNEKALTELHTVISSAGYDMSGSSLLYSMNIDVKVPEAVVDLHCSLTDVQYSAATLYKCKGAFMLPFTKESLEMENAEEDDIKGMINDYFGGCLIMNMFVKGKSS